MIYLTKNKPIPRRDFGPMPEGLTPREVAEEEAARDLAKTNEQLLADAHEELLKGETAHAQKRIASIMVRVARSSDKAASVLTGLTWVIAVLTAMLVILTIILLKKG